jgi:selenocysteine lyase/cysteine desulfurase
MSVKVQIPLPLRGSTGGLSEVEARGSNIREIIGDLEASYPGIRERLFRGDEELNRFVSIFVGGRDIRLLDGVAAIPGITVYGPRDRARRLSVAPFNIEGWSPDEAGAVLDQAFDIKVRTGLHCAPAAHKILGTYPHGSVRVSVGCFNTLDEIDSLLSALKKIAATEPPRLAADKTQGSSILAH